MLDALVGLATFETLVNVLWATLGGMVIGALPGLTATMGLALMTSLTYGMGGDQAILVLICLYVGTIYGGSRSAILLNIPGTPANAATAVEGYPMAVSGRASLALGLATLASLVGSLFGALCLYLIAPMLAEVALSFGSFEYFLLGVFGILIAGTMTSVEDPLKGWISGFFGLLVAMVGLEAMHAYERFSFGSLELSGGIALIPAMVGAFGVAELLVSMGRGKAAGRHDNVRPGKRLRLHPRPVAEPHDSRPLQHHRHRDRHHSRRRRGCRRMDFLRRRPPLGAAAAPNTAPARRMASSPPKPPTAQPFPAPSFRQ